MADDRLYRVTLQFDADGERFLARIPELDVEANGDTRAAALTALESEVEARVEHAAVEGEALPAPIDAEPPPLTVELTLAPSVARELQFQAKRAGLDPAALALQLVAQGLGPGRPARAGSRRPAPARDAAEASDATEATSEAAPPRDRDTQPPRRGNKSRRRRQEGYRGDIEDQASFLAYVRNMEKGRSR